MKKILEVDPSNDQARKTIRRLEPLAAEKREKMKEEMIGKFFFIILFYLYHFFEYICMYFIFIFIFCKVVCGHACITLPVFFIVKC